MRLDGAVESPALMYAAGGGIIRHWPCAERAQLELVVQRAAAKERGGGSEEEPLVIKICRFFWCFASMGRGGTNWLSVAFLWTGAGGTVSNCPCSVCVCAGDLS